MNLESNSCIDVLKSWNNGINFVQENLKDNIKGLRTPQIGAIYSIKSYWTLASSCATIVMPTGTGKTETMLMTIISEKCKKVLIIVPSDLLRKQTYEKAKTLKTLRDINIINQEIKNPIVNILNKRIDIEELKRIVSESNIIISTMALLNNLESQLLEILVDEITEVIIDEAHHIPAKTWSEIKSEFVKSRILQFTATPYRDDGKKIDGDIIYNFPLNLAQEKGYFKEIKFKYVLEFDNDKADYIIATEAIKQLEEDMKSGYNHVILARASTKKKAEYLYNNIYKKYYEKYRPVIITSNSKDKEKKQALEDINSYKSKILVCVDMFGEGIDIPELKIGAMHEKYKSLPITVQFIGRFARNKENLGKATIIANIADNEVKNELEKLYSENANWNYELSDISENIISNEIKLQEFAKGFNNKNISQITPKISAIPFAIKSNNVNFMAWKSILDEEKCQCLFDKEKNILVLVEKKEEKIDWLKGNELINVNFKLHIIYWNKDKKIAFIHSRDKSIGFRLMNAIFEKSERINGDEIFRCLNGINRLMLSTVGLKCEMDGPLRYKMFAGIDIEQAIAESEKQSCTKLNLFGIGYNGEEKVSIGCSKNGIIWSRWIESVSYWVEWCEEIRKKIQDTTIDTSKILKGVLVPSARYEKPDSIPIFIDWPLELDTNLDKVVKIVNKYSENIYDCSIELDSDMDKNSNDIEFSVKTNFFSEQFKQVYDSKNKKVYIVSNSQKNEQSKIFIGKEEFSLEEYFNIFPPKIIFADQSSTENELYVRIPEVTYMELDERNKEKWNWESIDITKESQLSKKDNKIILKDSIQYHLISKLKADENTYDLLFDDDGSGEMADVVAIRTENDSVIIDLYHCKFSKKDTPGRRVGDLYEVCGQTIKSIAWKSNKRNIVKHLKNRELSRLERTNISRFEIGEMKDLKIIDAKLQSLRLILNVNIVQPGIKIDELSTDMEYILCSTKSSLLTTCGIKLKIIGG